MRSVDPGELRKCLGLALDVVMAHRIAKGLSLDRGRVTLVRDTLEQRTLQALEEVDFGRMPKGWSWQKAAEGIALQIAVAIVHEQKSEPPAANG